MPAIGSADAPVRARQDDARVRARPGAAPRARRIGARVAARRMRHRRAADRPAPPGVREAGRRGPARPRLRRSEGDAADRRATIAFDTVTVTGTENVMLAATLARGTTRHRQRRPRARGDGPGPCSSRHGREDLGRRHRDDRRRGRRARFTASTHPIIPDRIEAGTYALAAAATRGDVTVRALRPEHLSALTVADVLRGRPDRHDRRHAARAGRRAAAVSNDVATAPYPGLPDGPAGAVDGARRRHGGHRHDHGDDLREPLPARGRARPHGGEDPPGGPLGGRRGALAAERRQASWRATCGPRRPSPSPP